MKKYILALGLAVSIAPTYTMDDSANSSEDYVAKEVDDIAALEAGVRGEDRHDTLAKRALAHGQKRRRRRNPVAPSTTSIEDELNDLERGVIRPVNPQLLYATALCDRAGVSEGIARNKIIDLIVSMNEESFDEFVGKMGQVTRGVAEDKKFNLLLEALVKWQEDSSSEVRKQLEVSKMALEESRRQFELQQKRADANQKRAILAGCIGGAGTVIATVIAVAKFVADGGV